MANYYQPSFIFTAICLCKTIFTNFNSEKKMRPIGNPAILFFCISLLLPFTLITITTASSRNETDLIALLAIRSQIQNPNGAISSWNKTVSMCQWKGVTCGSLHKRVTKLDLRNQNLGGSLSSYIGNLSFLRSISLDDNNFYGEIPQEIGHLFRLETLNISNNSFSGTIPANLSHCLNLINFRAKYNSLMGKIPTEFGKLSKLEDLNIRNNHLTEIPPFIGNLTALKVLKLTMNSISGSIPATLGHLTNLKVLGLAENELTGMIPISIYNISSLEEIHLVYNQLHGGLPESLGLTLPKLQFLNIGENRFTGPLPGSLSNVSILEELDIAGCNFNGKVSINFNGFQDLYWLNLGSNNLGSGEADDLDFVTALTNCSSLERFCLYSNQFGGMLPNSIANLSSTVIKLLIGNNQITGSIPHGIENLVNLYAIGMEGNQLTGTIPYSLGMLQKIQILSFSANYLSGRIPRSLGNLTLISKLYLGGNNLQGSIPPALGKCQNLLELDLGHNMLSETIPQEIFGIATLSLLLDLSNNRLTGSLPAEVGQLKNLVVLNISGNNLSGKIPAELGSCTSLELLILGGNSFYGSISPTLSSLRSIKQLDLSSNNLSGKIPNYFQNLSFLENLNLSFNNFDGALPTQGVFRNAHAISVIGNDKLCGGLPEFHLPSCPKPQKETHSLKLVLLIACGILGCILVSSSMLFFWFKNKKAKTDQPSSTSPLSNLVVRVSYQELLEATDGFSFLNFIGEGSFGRVYKGILNNNQNIAVKVMKLQNQGAAKSFMAECETLRSIRHRNLVKIITACSSVDFQNNDFKALVYDYMPNGSLDRWLHTIPEANEEPGDLRELSFLQRLNIAIDVASALDYLHHHCLVPIIHCDLKPSNVLLDNDMVAHVADFGLARFLLKATDKDQTSSLGLKGTIGYAAPEYGTGSEATSYGDVYSYGILLMEMFTGKQPTDDIFKDGLNIHEYTKAALHEQTPIIVDHTFSCEADSDDVTTGGKMRECLTSILGIGVACSVQAPADRMDITCALGELHLVREEFVKS